MTENGSTYISFYSATMTQNSPHSPSLKTFTLSCFCFLMLSSLLLRIRAQISGGGVPQLAVVRMLCCMYCHSRWNTTRLCVKHSLLFTPMSKGQKTTIQAVCEQLPLCNTACSLHPVNNGHKTNYTTNKTLGRAQDPRTNGAWLSKLTQWNMKCLS